VLLKVAGAGACHSDVAIYKEFTEGAPGAIPPRFTLGHESSGWIEELGPGVEGFTVGDAFLVYGPIGCGHCGMCARGQDTYCENAQSMPYLGVGLGRDGGWPSIWWRRPGTWCRSAMPTRWPRPR
jgi:alcohol dehydrogenase, propanol-preferring